MKPLKSIGIQGYKVSCYLGAYEEERKKSQTIEIDIQIWGDWAQQDLLDATYNYDHFFPVIKNLIQKPFHLIETLAQKVAKKLLLEKKIQKVEVKIKKRLSSGVLAYATYEEAQ